MMDINRIKELEFLVRTRSPVPVTESRNSRVFQDELYNDFYTIKELIEIGYLDYLGRDTHRRIFVRPVLDFSVFVVDEICFLKGGEIVTLSLTSTGCMEFENWSHDDNDPLN